MVRFNTTSVYTLCLVIVITILCLRYQYKNSIEHENETRYSPVVTEPPGPTTKYYTIEKFGEEGPKRNFSIKTHTHADQYCVAYKFLEASETFREADGLEPVTMATHGTSDMAETIETLPSLWDGPISIGVFVDYHSSNVLEYLSEIHRCDINFRRKMTVHIAFRHSAFQKECPVIEIPAPTRSCREFYASQNDLRKAVIGPFQLYPSNLMRNIARKGALTDYHFLMDVDMIPSEGFATKIKATANEVLGDGNNKKVLVIRRFETEKGSIIPRNMDALQRSIITAQTFEFHYRFFPQGHHIDGLDVWFDESKQSDQVKTTEMRYHGFDWEVQTILHRNDPYNADYFPSRIRVMHSLVYALCRADYTFHVPTGVFDVHEGVKRSNTIYSKATIMHQEAYAMKISLSRYVREMDVLYPNTLEKCGAFPV